MGKFILAPGVKTSRQHVAICSARIEIEQDKFSPLMLGNLFDGALSGRHVGVIVPDRESDIVVLHWFYAAVGAWPKSDIRNRFDRFNIRGATYRDDDRAQLCGHETTTANCNVDKEEADRLAKTALSVVGPDCLDLSRIVEETWKRHDA